MKKDKLLKGLLSTVITAMLITSITACGGGTTDNASNSSGSGQSTASKLTDKGNNNDGSKAVKELTFMTQYTGDKETEYMQKFVQQYNTNNPDVKVKYESVPPADYMGTKLSTAFATGDGPDIFIVSPGTIGNYIDSGIALELDSYITPELKKDFSPSSLDVVTLNNKIYALPFETDLIGLYYDEDVLSKAGIAPPKTWNELLSAAKKLTTDKRAGITFDMTKGAYEVFTWYPFMWQTGSDIFTPDRKHSALNSDGVVKALKLWKDFVDSKAANMKPSRSASDIGIMADGETAFQITGSWSIVDLETKYPNKNIKVMPLPIPEGGSKSSVAGGWKLMVNKNNKYPDDAAKFAMWLFGDKPDNEVDWITKAKFAYSPRQSVMDAAKDVFNTGLRQVFTKEIYGTEKPEPRMPSEVQNIICDMLQDALFKSAPDAAAKKAHEKLESFLKDYKGSI